jgi:hypothetical protein
MSFGEVLSEFCMTGKPPAMAPPWGWGGAAVAPSVSSVTNMSRPI